MDYSFTPPCSFDGPGAMVIFIAFSVSWLHTCGCFWLRWNGAPRRRTYSSMPFVQRPRAVRISTLSSILGNFGAAVPVSRILQINVTEASISRRDAWFKIALLYQPGPSGEYHYFVAPGSSQFSSLSRFGVTVKKLVRFIKYCCNAVLQLTGCDRSGLLSAWCFERGSLFGNPRRSEPCLDRLL